MYQDSIAITLANLVRNKEGLFTNNKQRDFILKQASYKEKVYTSVINEKFGVGVKLDILYVYVTLTLAKHPSTVFYYLDENGVVKVENIDFNCLKTTITFDRSTHKK